ncbi:Himeic acid A biosynthesis cluster [Hyphodiscus hymeniophilus]|uniref:Himeic acid A biosynthesis cluster n=1 Tax=Hyphodiscus hymeniophilus TaxID=353542 RepID=A0A9P7AY42_9HELO|nr:Himeic acid A biosynthesis cluster [Hyphodiscus hymeniophilus]
MVQNLTGLGLPGIASNISNIDQCTPALCDINLYGTVNYIPSLPVAMSFGLILEVLGYIGRLSMHYNVFNENLFLINIICLTIAPVFFTAAIYLTLARIIVYYGTYNSRLSPKAYSIVFMTSDVIALILQSVGGGIADEASTKAGRSEGVNIMVAGLAFQVVSLLLFMGLAAEFFLKVKKDRSQIRSTSGLGASPKGYKAFVWACAAASILILVRSCYRVAELAHGFDGKLANAQVPFIIFESTIMSFALIIMTIFHPGRFIGRAGWKLSGWGKNAKIEEKKQPSAMDNGDWNAKYGAGQPTTNKRFSFDEGTYQREYSRQ